MIRLPGTRNTFLLIIISLFIFWLITVLFFFDRWNQLTQYSSVKNEIAGIRYNYSLYREVFDGSYLKPGVNESDQYSRRERTGRLLEDMQVSLNLIENDFLFSNDPGTLRNIIIIRENLNEINLLLTEFESLRNQIGNLYTGTLGRTREIFHDLNNISTTGFFSQYYPRFIQFLIYPDPLIPEEILDAWIIRKDQVIRELPPSLSSKHGVISGDDLKAYCDELIAGISQIAKITRKIGSPDQGGIIGDLYINHYRIERVLSETKTSLNNSQTKFISGLKTGLLLWLIISGALFIYFLHALSASINKRLGEIEIITESLGKGDIPEEIPVIRMDEIGRIKSNINKLLNTLNHKVVFADRIAEGDFNTGLKTAGKEDILGNSLLKLSGKLADAEREESLRKEEEKRHSWTSEGLAKFGEIFRSEREDVRELSYKVIFNLVKHLDAAAGAVYLADQEKPGEPEYEMSATFAWDRRKFIQKRILPGEGLVGTCALEKETIFLSEIPDNYLEISSGLINAKPVCLLFVPLKIENEILGVIEIAAIKLLREFEIQFVEQLGEITATSLAAVRVNERTAYLLEQSTRQTEEMQKHEERMRKNMEELQNSQEESKRKESEISGILNAVNASSLVAEFTINGRFSDINEKLQFLFESPREHILGKHHSDFAVTNKYSNEYKQFWRDLREGKTIHITEKYRLYSGMEIWLEETFSAVLDNEGKPVKILTIAHDITESKKQQEALIKQSGEINRRSSEMESFSMAVDNSMIHCELSAEGDILSANPNFIEITGYSKRELIGKNNRIFLKGTEKDQFEKIWTEISKEKIYSGAIRRTKPTGEEVWLMANFSPVTDESGSIYKVYFLAQDITEKRLKYQLLEEANKEIERLRDRINKLETQ